jgi:Macrocin-O-methyltransferase (TylF)
MANDDQDAFVFGDPQVQRPARRYLELLKRCLTRELFIAEEVVDVLSWPEGGVLGDPAETWAGLGSSGFRIVRPIQNRELRETGEDWPLHAETMVGRARLDNVEYLVTRALAEGTPGDLVETGVWRGGTVILMRAVLEAYGDEDRRVWGCDSFEGLPEPDLDRYPADEGFVIPESFARDLAKEMLSVSVERVQANLERYGLFDDRVVLVKGWFRDTLPSAPIDRIAVLRLDGDLYESTMDALVHLEPKVSPGGFVIVDDYNGIEACRDAADQYRAEHSITDVIHEIDWTGVWWQKSPEG